MRRPDAAICRAQRLREIRTTHRANAAIRRAARAAWHPLASYGVVVLSRRPIRRLHALELPSEMGRRLLVAELACGLTVATVHLESMADSAAARLAQI